MPTASRMNTGRNDDAPADVGQMSDLLHKTIVRWLAAGIVVALLALLWLDGSITQLWRDEDAVMARIERSGVMRVGMDANYPPFEWIDAEGVYQGYDVDLARALAARLGVEAQFVSVHFDGLYDALEATKFDLIISALPYDRTMTRDLRYSQAYFDAGLVLLARDGDLQIETVEAIDGMRVAVELGSEGHLHARLLQRDKGLALDMVIVREPEALVGALLDGSADLAICDRVSALAYRTAHPELHIVGPALTQEAYVIAAPIEAIDLMALVDEALDAWREGGELATWEARWLGGGDSQD